MSITTDNATGEYTAYLPPLIYTVDTLKILTNLAATFDIQSVLDLTKSVVLTTLPFAPKVKPVVVLTGVTPFAVYAFIDHCDGFILPPK